MYNEFECKMIKIALFNTYEFSQPNIRQTTLASSVSKASSHTVPQVLL